MPALFLRYDIVTECVMLSLCVLMLLLILVQQPKMTRLMVMCTVGFGLSAIEILVHIFMLNQVSCEATFSISLFNATYIIFGILYIFILNLIFSYINFLSYKRRLQAKLTLLMEALFAVVYAAIIFYPMVTDKLIVYSEGKVILSNWYLSYVVCGIIDAGFVFTASLINNKTIARVVVWGSAVFIPADIMVLVTQFFFPTLVITSYTYVLPFTLFYILFHNTKFDENFGCRSEEPLYIILDRAAKSKKKYVYIYVRFPQLKNREFDDIMAGIKYASSKICREIEALSYGMQIFSHNMYTYMGFCYVKDEEEAERIISGIQKIMENEVRFGQRKLDPAYKMITVRESAGAPSGKVIKGAVRKIQAGFTDYNTREYYNVTKEDVQDYIKSYAVEHILSDIRARGDLDDPRIICYAQPIADADTGKCRVAEALMRIEDNGRMLFPDEFIGVAEQINCIHPLTLIMVNKVCKKIKSLEQEGYKVDAISINCSTGEFQQPTFASEILGIIEQNGVDPGKIRIEITESVELSDYNSILNTMKELNRAGVRLVLDDFGTGYSNMERIVTYPFMTIKFDKAMLYKAIEDHKADELLKLLVDFFNKCGILSLVEGVENAEQRDFSVERGFRLIQGYFYSPPVPMERLADYFEKQM